MVSQDNIADNHLDGAIGKEAPRADDLAMSKVEIVFASGGKLYSQELATAMRYVSQVMKNDGCVSYGANRPRQVVFGCCTDAYRRTCRRSEPARGQYRSRTLPSGCERLQGG